MIYNQSMQQEDCF